MKQKAIKAAALLMAVCVIVSLCACRHGESNNPHISTTHRSVTTPTSSAATDDAADTVTAVAPVGKDAILNYFNDAVTKFGNFKYDFNKHVDVTLTSFSAGSLANVDKATASYQSMLRTACGDMMGVCATDTAYYVGDDMKAAFPVRLAESENITDAKATAKGGEVVVELTCKSLSEDGVVTVKQWTSDYMTNGLFLEKVKAYSASVSESSVKIGGVKAKAVIDYATKNFVSLEITFQTSFQASQLSLAYVSGGPIRGVTKTTVTYKDFSERE